MTKTRTWVAGTVVLCLLLSVAAWFLLIAPQRAAAAEFTEQAEAARAQNAQLQAKIAELKAQFAELPQRKAELAALKAAMPEEPALAALTRDLQAQADAAGVTLMSIAPAPAVAVVDPAAVAAAAAAAAPADPAAEGAAPAPAAAPVAQDVLAAVPLTVTVVGSFDGASTFVKGVQTSLTRSYLLTGLNVVAEADAAPAAGGKPAVANGDVTMTVTGSVFVLKPAATAAATTVAPTTTTP
jgi:Tfp pilus assembly protein PilO